MTPQSILLLQFDADHDDLGKGKKLSDGLSVALQIGESLWLANDESVSLERLSLSPNDKTGGPRLASHHKQFLLGDYLNLPVTASADPALIAEADVEGLDYDGDYLWLVGSHSLKRAKPTIEDGVRAAHKQMAKVSSDGNRYLLARIPVVDADGIPSLARKTTRKGKKFTAAQLHGDHTGNELTKALKEDEHIGPFLSIPGKDNGFDIEGLAVVGKRIFLGLRGPVLRGWAVIIELEPEQEKNQPERLKLKAIGPKKRLFRKHFLQLGGLGIRDLCVQGSDLLILAGPTMDLDGPVTVFRWPGGSAPKTSTMVPAEALQHVLDVPFGHGADHAEGMALIALDRSKAHSLLMVYDSAAVGRRLGRSTAVADVFSLPVRAKK